MLATLESFQVWKHMEIGIHFIYIEVRRFPEYFNDLNLERHTNRHFSPFYLRSRLKTVQLFGSPIVYGSPVSFSFSRNSRANLSGKI